MFCRWAVWPTGLLFLIILQLAYFIFAKAHQDHLKLLNIGHKRSIRAKRTVFHFFCLYTYICIHYLHQWKSRWSSSLLLLQIYTAYLVYKNFVLLACFLNEVCTVWKSGLVMESLSTTTPFLPFFLYHFANARNRLFISLKSGR